MISWEGTFGRAAFGHVKGLTEMLIEEMMSAQTIVLVVPEIRQGYSEVVLMDGMLYSRFLTNGGTMSMKQVRGWLTCSKPAIKHLRGLYKYTYRSYDWKYISVCVIVFSLLGANRLEIVL
ncbi:hypothetical protein WG66_012942 [Moniliophthora roreri]|nr:hypothetical protein WG66_012942 [Moniliophthora roreri]